jgi:predicted GIY-YIG superfamily endonuclease
MPWYVYICKSAASHYYVGISPDPAERLVKHNSGLGSKMARDQGVFTLLYVSRPFSSKSQARKREIQIKGWSREKKEKLINGEWQ